MKSRQKRFRATLAAQFDACKESKFETDNQTLEKLLENWELSCRFGRTKKEVMPVSKEHATLIKKLLINKREVVKN